MIKTIKVKKKMRLDDLIKYVRENGVNSQAFVSDCGRASVYFDSEQNFSLGEYTFGELDIERTFTVEVEEEITDYTVFKSALAVHHGEELELYENLSIKGFKYRWPNSLQMHAVINGKLELVWEAE